MTKKRERRECTRERAKERGAEEEKKQKYMCDGNFSLHKRERKARGEMGSEGRMEVNISSILSCTMK